MGEWVFVPELVDLGDEKLDTGEWDFGILSKETINILRDGIVQER